MLGFSAEYVERITPNEREIFKQLYKKEMEEKNKSKNKEPTGQTIGNGIETR